MFRTKLGLRTVVIFSVLLLFLLLVALVWLDQYEHRQAERQIDQSTEQTARALVASLKSIMLSGKGPIAHDWLMRVKSSTNFEDVRIFRRDGTEAFIDNATIDQVNKWRGEKLFERHSPGQEPEHITPSLQEKFAAAVAASPTEIHEKGHLTLLYPIHIENSCLQCHGYESNPVRGVLMLVAPTSSLAAAVASQERQAQWVVGSIILLAGMMLMWLMNREVIRPVGMLQAGARRIKQGDTTYRMQMEREDEIGDLATSLNKMVDYLQSQMERNKLLAEAITSLSQELAGEKVLRKVGELAMQITGARYAMIGYLKDGEKHFISLGLDDATLAGLAAHPPQGLGLLGLLWSERQTVRLDSIVGHPESFGFPAGHPPMSTMLGVPIEFADHMVGALYLTDKLNGQPFSDDDEAAVSMLAASCAVALTNARQFEQLEQSNALLDQRVQERTSELRDANRMLNSRGIELELINDQLNQANEAKSHFLANTSHELRTPLNSIIGFSDLLLVNTTPALQAKQREYVEFISSSGKQLLTLINGLLDLSKIEAGMLEINEEATRASAAIEFTISQLKPLADRKKLEMHVVKPVEEHVVYLDSGKLQQIWINLIGNAIKFTPEGGQIEVGWNIRGDADNAFLEGYVQDSGIGIAPDDIERIFEPFIQAEGGMTREFAGTGLGLTLVRRLLEMQGGEIHVESTPGMGSRFSFKLPTHLVVVQDTALAESHVKSGTGDKPVNGNSLQIVEAAVEEEMPEDRERPVILVIDDNRARAATAVVMLNEEGYLGNICDLDQTVRIAEEKLPFLIMVGMPDDPVDIYRRLHLLRSRKPTRNIPLVLLGGDAESPSYSLGAIDTVDKQMTRNDLVDMISRHGRHAMSDIMTVLVVDDDPSVREYIREALRGQGYRILLASNGPDGLQAAIEYDPDLIILDLMMPGMNGFEVVDQLKKHAVACDIPVIIFTAKDLTREEMMRLGQEVEKVMTKGMTSRSDLLRELRSMELLYPVQARLMDSMLRCYNPRYMQLRLAQEYSRAIRYNQQFTLVGWEMDGFSNYVHQHGQRWGMAALKANVELVKMATRKGDVLVRTGEAAFTLILPGASAALGELVAEKIRLRIRQNRFPLPADKVGRLTASFGTVSFDGELTLEEMEPKLRAHIDMAQQAGGDQGIYDVKEDAEAT